MPSWLAPWPSNFRPLPNEFGALFNTLRTTLNQGAGPVLVGTATTNVYVGVPAKKFYVAGAAINGATVFTGSSTVTATLIKKSGSTTTALTAAYDLKAAVSSAGYADVPITATDADATLDAGDQLYWAVGAAGTLGPTTADLIGVVGITIIQ